jgi:serine/threonine protein kinase
MPEIEEHGMALLTNLNEDDQAKTKSCESLFGYYIMPHYHFDLEKYIYLSSKDHELPQLGQEHIFDIICQIMIALQALHHIGYVHNDIKPSNIMITFTGNIEIEATLIDYGFATKFLEKDKHTHI